MCEPLSATTALYLTMATTAATAAMSYVSAEDNAGKQQKAINDNYAMAASAAQDNYHQTDAAAGQQKSERALEATKEQSRLKVIAGESGALGGLSADRMMNEAASNASADMATIEANRSNANLQTQREAKAGQVSAAGQLASIKRGNLLGSGLQIAGAYVRNEAEIERLNGVSKYKSPGKQYSGVPIAASLA